MYTYQLVLTSNEILRSDGAVIPKDPNNRDWLAYEAWLKAGNVPASIPLSEVQLQRTLVISNACANAIINGFSSAALGNAHYYPNKDTDQRNRLAASSVAMWMILEAWTWKPRTPVYKGTNVYVNKVVYVCTTPGTSDLHIPLWNTSEPVKDNDVVWEVWTSPIWCADEDRNWCFLEHRTDQLPQIGNEAVQAKVDYQKRNEILANQIQAATTAEQVQAITW